MRRFATILSVGVLASALLMSVAVAADQPRLGTASNYAVMAATTITSTGLTVINGNLAISPNGATSVTGFPPGVVTGAIDANNASPVPSTVGPEMGLTTASPAPTVPNTSVNDQVSAPQHSITYLVAVGFVVIALSLAATLKRREISASVERADKA